MLKIAVDNINNWIFVTGAIRSGTTFVGRILSLPLEVDYIHEPFNSMCGMPGIEQDYRYVRPSLDTKQMQSYHQLTQSIFNYNLTLRSWHPPKDPWPRKAIKRITGSRGPFYLWLAKTNPFHQAAVIKDPTGSLLSEYLHLNFGVKPVIVIKHPTSFIASLKRVNWWPHPGKMKDQPHLIEDYFSDEADFLYKKWSSPILRSAAYWRALNKVFLAQMSKYPDWQIITHEELSQNPVSSFQNLYEALALPWSESIKKKIIQQTQNNRSAEAKKGLVQDFQRNSKDIFEMRRNSLSLEERKAIFEVVEDVALQIYSKESFAI